MTKNSHVLGISGKILKIFDAVYRSQWGAIVTTGPNVNDEQSIENEGFIFAQFESISIANSHCSDVNVGITEHTITL